MLTLKQLIAEGEHQQQDFKFRIDDQKKIARTLVAFANTDGGRLLIGVKDNGKVVGVHPEEEIHMIDGAAKVFCSPALEYTTRIWQDDFRLVLEVVVEADASKKYRAKDDDQMWKAFFRKEDKTLLANKIILKTWKLAKTELKKPTFFKEDALMCLQFIATQEVVTLSKLYRSLALTKGNVDEVVALLLYWKMIDFNVSNEGFHYFVTDTN